MTTGKLEQAARQALGALVRAEAMYGQPNADIQTALREALAEQAEQEPVAFADLYSVAGKLALELECLLLDTKDLSVVSKWWDSAHDALEQWRSIKDTAPVSAEAIRAEALEEVAKWLAESGLIGSNDCAAAIRGMK